MNSLLEHISSESMFISEREGCECTGNSASDINLSLWKAMVGGDFFATRLAIEGISEHRARNLSGVSHRQDTPKWLEWLSEFMNVPIENEMKIDFEKIGGPVFLINSFIPILAFCKRKLMDETNLEIIPEGLVDGAIIHLARDFMSISHRCIFPEIFGEAGDRFFQDGKVLDMQWFEYLFCQYPVLARLFFEKSTIWAFNSVTLFGRLKKDMAVIEKTFGVKGLPTQMDTGFSDSHNKGQSVALLKWNDGSKIVYKPHSSLLAKEWIDFLKVYNVSTFDTKILNRQNYSYTEFVHYDPNGNPLTFYYHAGMLLAACMISGATDIHYENLIAKGDIPVIIDTETIACPLLGKLVISPDQSGLLSVKKYVKGFCIGDWGGLVANENGVNVPAVPFRKEYMVMLMDGFKSVMHHEKYSFQYSNPVRCVLRNTMLYSTIQTQCLNRKRMRNGFLYSLPIEQLSSVLKYGQDKLGIYKCEQKSMERLDIPYFYSFPDGKDLFSEGRMLVKDFFDKSVNEHIDMRVNLLKDDQEIERCIKLVLESLRRPTPSVTPLDKILFAQIMNKC